MPFWLQVIRSAYCCLVGPELVLVSLTSSKKDAADRTAILVYDANHA